MQLSVRNVSEKIFQEFKASAVKKKMDLGQAITLAMKNWMERQEPKKSFLSFKPEIWGNRTERTSREIDKVLYS